MSDSSITGSIQEDNITTTENDNSHVTSITNSSINEIVDSSDVLPRNSDANNIIFKKRKGHGNSKEYEFLILLSTMNLL